MAEPTIAVAGGGLAGAKTAEALRAEGFTGRIVVVGAEAHAPYERPPLSKGYLQGNAERDSVLVHPPQWYDDNAVELRLGSPVTAVDTGSHEITTADGYRLGWDTLVLATGSRPRLLPLPDADPAGVAYLRDLGDSDRLRAGFRTDARVVVIGGGWIGLETAAAAVTAGAHVTVVESAELPLLRVLGPQPARVFADLHVERGVDLRLGRSVASVTATGSGGNAVVLDDGSELAADLVLVGIGAVPNVEPARDAGLSVDDGILVDEHLRTSHPDVLAVGDIANAWHPFYGRRLRVEHWANALNQPAVAARSALGLDAVYDRLPYFYTDQYDLGMEYTGHADPRSTEVVVRGDLAGREFIAFWLDGGRVVAGMNVNVWDVTGPIGALIRSEAQVSADRLADPGVALEDLAG